MTENWTGFEQSTIHNQQCKMWYPLSHCPAADMTPCQAVESCMVKWFPGPGRTWRWLEEDLGLFRVDRGSTLYRITLDGTNWLIEWE